MKSGLPGLPYRQHLLAQQPVNRVQSSVAGVGLRIGLIAGLLQPGIVRQRADAAGIPFVTTQAGAAMFGLYFTGADDIVTFDDVMTSDAERFKRFFHLMLEEGVYLAPSAFEAGFMSVAHSEEDINNTIDAARKVFAKL